MSSIDDRLAQFYRETILANADQISLSADGRQPEGESHYISRAPGARVQVEFGEDLQSVAAIGAALDAHWKGSVLEGAGAKLAALCESIDHGDETADVSSNVYEMF